MCLEAYNRREWRGDDGSAEGGGAGAKKAKDGADVGRGDRETERALDEISS